VTSKTEFESSPLIILRFENLNTIVNKDLKVLEAIPL